MFDFNYIEDSKKYSLKHFIEFLNDFDVETIKI